VLDFKFLESSDWLWVMTGEEVGILLLIYKTKSIATHFEEYCPPR